MWTRFLTASALAALLFTATPALAGGVIIDGRGVGSLSTALTTNHTDTNDKPAPGDDNGTAQMLYLWAATVFNTDEAAQLGYLADPDYASQRDLVGDSDPQAIIDGVELDGEGGCQAVPPSALAGLLALGCLLRRRR